MKKSTLQFNATHLVSNDAYLLFSIPYTDIVFIRCAKPYIEIYLHDKHYVISQTLAIFVENLPSNFYLCNKSEIVNLMHVTDFNKKQNILTTSHFTHTHTPLRGHERNCCSPDCKS